jgi:hypothetical protein
MIEIYRQNSTKMWHLAKTITETRTDSLNKGNNKITEFRTILQRESQNS